MPETTTMKPAIEGRWVELYGSWVLVVGAQKEAVGCIWGPDKRHPEYEAILQGTASRHATLEAAQERILSGLAANGCPIEIGETDA